MAEADRPKIGGPDCRSGYQGRDVEWKARAHQLICDKEVRQQMGLVDLVNDFIKVGMQWSKVMCESKVLK